MVSFLAGRKSPWSPTGMYSSVIWKREWTLKWHNLLSYSGNEGKGNDKNVCRRCSQGLDGKTTDQDPCWYTKHGKHKKKNNCNLTYIIVGNGWTFLLQILLLSIVRSFMKFSIKFPVWSKPPNIFRKKENKAEHIIRAAAMCPQFEQWVQIHPLKTVQ